MRAFFSVAKSSVKGTLGAVLALGIAQSLACSGAATPTVTNPPPITPPATQWVQVWSDEFDGPAGTPVDNTKWNYDAADGCSVGICGWGNNEKEYYSADPGTIALNGQGQLMIVAQRAPAGLTCYYGPCRYTSAKITTRDKMFANPGRVEARIKLSAGQGLWPAFWMLGHLCGNGAPWPNCGEIDIMENKGSQPASTSSAMHGLGYSGATPFAHTNTLTSGNYTDSFHIFAVEWDSGSIRWFVDDTRHYGVTADAIAQYGPSILNQSFYVILNLAVGGNFDGDPQSDTIFPATMLVDYVRVFEKK
jgi:beta-glucanase (GH16 family)